jgi:hypothetical protein
MTAETETQDSMTHTMIWLGVMIAIVVGLAYVAI